MSLALFLSKTRFHCVPPLKYASCFQSRTTRLYTPLCRSVHLSIHPSIHSSIGPSITLYFSAFMRFLGMPLLPKCSPDLNYGPWPPEATGVALYLALLVADWLLYKRLCPSICLWVCVNKWRKQAFPAHPSGTGIGFVLSFLVKTNHFLYNKNERFKNNLLPNAYKWCFIPSPCSVYETPKMAFLKCQKWRF